MSDKYDRLEKLKRLHDDGVLTAAEYEAEKALILSGASALVERRFWGMEERVFCMLIHLSQLLGVVLPFIPFIGVIMPVVMWASEKERSRVVDAHGRIVLNWVISYVIYFAISLVLMVIIIGGFLLVAVIILNIIFAIIGGVKANSGEYWKYPLSIPFFSIPEPEAPVAAEPQTPVTRNEPTETVSGEPKEEREEAEKKDENL